MSRAGSSKGCWHSGKREHGLKAESGGNRCTQQVSGLSDAVIVMPVPAMPRTARAVYRSNASPAGTFGRFDVRFPVRGAFAWFPDRRWCGRRYERFGLPGILQSSDGPGGQGVVVGALAVKERRQTQSGKDGNSDRTIETFVMMRCKARCHMLSMEAREGSPGMGKGADTTFAHIPTGGRPGTGWEQRSAWIDGF
jgi:hypothetical protein